MTMSPAAVPGVPNALRVAGVWGTTVVAMKTLSRGESFMVGDHEDAMLPIPEGMEMSGAPLRASAGGWELDARGCVGGLLTLRGRAEDPVAIAKVGTPVPVMPGDHGLIQYGQFSIFFQYTSKPIKMSAFSAPELLLLLAIFCSFVLHGGGILLLSTLSTPLPLPKPAELETPEDLASRFKIKRAELEPPPPPVAGNEKGSGVPNPGPKDNKVAGAGQKAKGAEGKLGINKTGELSVPGDKPTYGGVAEVLEGDTGKEMRKTLDSISTVSAALAGINPRDVQMGGGTGAGLRGPGAGGGGNGPTFGTGGVDTGFGANTGAGVGGGGPGRPGAGGPGRGGAGGGPGAPGERAVVATGAAAARGSLTSDQVRRVVLAHVGAVRACYETEAQKNPALKGGMSVQWTVAPDGSVMGASLAGSSLGNPRVEGCVVRQVQRWKFPAAEAQTSVTFPFKFGVGG